MYRLAALASMIIDLCTIVRETREIGVADERARARRLGVRRVAVFILSWRIQDPTFPLYFCVLGLSASMLWSLTCSRRLVPGRVDHGAFLAKYCMCIIAGDVERVGTRHK